MRTPAAGGIITDGLVGRWELNGDVLDSSPTGADGTITGMTPVWEAGPLPGMGALYFNGSGYVTTTNTELSGHTEFTLCCWVNREADDAYAGMLTTRDSPNGINGLISGSPVAKDQCEFHVGAAGSVGSIQSTAVPPIFPLDTWVHAAVRLSNSQLSIFKDGTTVIPFSSVGDTVAAPLMTRGFYLGFESAIGDRKLQGYMSDARLYNRVLSDSELLKIATNVG